ncbi:MAG: efflux RND transporter periplasmic adaptor subunit [candidate division Zixibacteria bacterium]|nr:efflux RND transporter periplasmic adaptor subunit [candidate division Zixibacteria bacterium]
MSNKSKFILPAVILIAGYAIMWLFFNLKSDPPKRNTTQRTKIVETDIVNLAGIPAKIVAYGRAASAQPVQLYSEVSGILMEGGLPFQPAQSFKKGDLLLKIDDRQSTLTLNSTKSDLLTALATVLPEIKVDFPEEYQVWQKYFDNCKFGVKLEELPRTDNQKIKLFLSRFNVYKLYFAVRDLEIRLAKHYFYAPFNGSIVIANLRVGSTARNGTLLGEIINLEKLEVEVPVSIQDIQWIDKSNPVRLKSSEITGDWTGKVTRVGSAIDNRTQSIQVFIEIDKNQDFPVFDGVFFEATIPGRRINNAYILPHRALYNEEYVYLISDGKLEYREIEVARSENGSVIISSGLNIGDTLVIEAMQGVYAGMPARSKTTSAESRVVK